MARKAIRRCPTDAITGERKLLHVIDPELCINCGACGVVCPDEAIFDNEGNLCEMLKPAARPKAYVDLQSCVGCEWCVWACPFDALEMAGLKSSHHFQVAEVIAEVRRLHPLRARLPLRRHPHLPRRLAAGRSAHRAQRPLRGRDRRASRRRCHAARERRREGGVSDDAAADEIPTPAKKHKKRRGEPSARGGAAKVSHEQAGRLLAISRPILSFKSSSRRSKKATTPWCAKRLRASRKARRTTKARRSARELRRRLDPDPTAVYLLAIASILLVFLACWYWMHPHAEG